MKICMIGLGSIGIRHVNNILHVLKKRNKEVEIDALRKGKNELSKDVKRYINKIYYDISDLPNDYDTIFITNPTILHYDTIKKAVPKTKHMFIEKPVFGEKGRKIEELKLCQDGIYYVACPLRHKPSIRYVKQLLENGEKFVSVRAISSSYLPLWRKGTDYRKTYSANKSLGGGVVWDLIHEWDYLTYLFGFPEEIYKLAGKYSNLEIDTEDIAVYIAKYMEMLVEVHLDYCGINTVRTLELIGNEKRFIVDLINEKVTVYSCDTCEVIQLEKEDCYINEMEYFFYLLEGKEKNMNSVENAAQVLELI